MSALRLLLLLSITAVAMAVAATAQTTPQPGATVLALIGGRVYADPDGVPIDDATVVLVGDRVAAVATRSAVTVPAGATVLDCKGLVITAGFYNAHVHFTDPARWMDAGKQPAEN